MGRVGAGACLAAEARAGRRCAAALCCRLRCGGCSCSGRAVVVRPHARCRHPRLRRRLRLARIRRARACRRRGLLLARRRQGRAPGRQAPGPAAAGRAPRSAPSPARTRLALSARGRALSLRPQASPAADRQQTVRHPRCVAVTGPCCVAGTRGRGEGAALRVRRSAAPAHTVLVSGSALTTPQPWAPARARGWRPPRAQTRRRCGGRAPASTSAASWRPRAESSASGRCRRLRGSTPCASRPPSPSAPHRPGPRARAGAAELVGPRPAPDEHGTRTGAQHNTAWCTSDLLRVHGSRRRARSHTPPAHARKLGPQPRAGRALHTPRLSAGRLPLGAPGGRLPRGLPLGPSLEPVRPALTGGPAAAQRLCAAGRAGRGARVPGPVPTLRLLPLVAGRPSAGLGHRTAALGGPRSVAAAAVALPALCAARPGVRGGRREKQPARRAGVPRMKLRVRRRAASAARQVQSVRPRESHRARTRLRTEQRTLGGHGEQPPIYLCIVCTRAGLLGPPHRCQAARVRARRRAQPRRRARRADALRCRRAHGRRAQVERVSLGRGRGTGAARARVGGQEVDRAVAGGGRPPRAARLQLQRLLQCPLKGLRAYSQSPFVRSSSSKASNQRPSCQAAPGAPPPTAWRQAAGGFAVGPGTRLSWSLGVCGHARTALQHWLPFAVCGPVVLYTVLLCTSSAGSSGGCGAGAGARAAGERCGCALGEGGCCGGGREPGGGEPGGCGAPELPARLSAQGGRLASSRESRTWQCSEARSPPSACRAARVKRLIKGCGAVAAAPGAGRHPRPDV